VYLLSQVHERLCYLSLKFASLSNYCFSTTFANLAQRPKILVTNQSLQQQIAYVWPTLTPLLPVPMASSSPAIPNADELAFFDGVRKFIGNQQTFNEFLKLLNLFPQGLIDKAVLNDKVCDFIGGNKELLKWFQEILQCGGVSDEILRTPHTKKARLSVCRSLGPSYRLLPKLACTPLYALRLLSLRFLKACLQFPHLLTNTFSTSSFPSLLPSKHFRSKNPFPHYLHCTPRRLCITSFPSNSFRQAPSSGNFLSPHLQSPQHERVFELNCMQSTQEMKNHCSGRDEMCNEVLNDTWASHPTWGSAEPGDVTHQKNQYEEILYRIEEERHEYDLNIEANRGTIELLVPIALRIATMSPDEKLRFRLAPGLGGKSKTIYQRVIKKVWGNDVGLEVIEGLHGDPVRAVPLVLTRLKQMDEEWTAAQRQWQKVWRDQTARVFWKSLDHQGISIKQADKKRFQLKTLVAEIFAKRKEQMAGRLYPSTESPEYQFTYDFKDTNIILDVSRLLAVSLLNSSGFSIGDCEKINGFIKCFIPFLFGIKSTDVDGIVTPVSRKSPYDRGHSERPAIEEGCWIARPNRYLTGVKTNFPMSLAEHEGRQLHKKRTVFTLFCNATIYGFFRAFQILYYRLAAVKATEDQIRADVERQKAVKVAWELNILTHRIENVFSDTSPTANYYRQILNMCSRVLAGELNATTFEETLRMTNVQQGWKLFTLEKMCNSILKFIQSIVPSNCKENTEKEKAAEILRRFEKDRNNRGYEKEGGEYGELIAYRRAIEGILGQSDDLYRIDWVLVHSHSVMSGRKTDSGVSMKPISRRLFA